LLISVSNRDLEYPNRQWGVSGAKLCATSYG
jgi:hypothetical protein